MSNHISFPNIVNIKDTFMYLLNKMGKTDSRFFDRCKKIIGSDTGIVLNLENNIIIFVEMNIIIVFEFNNINDDFIIYCTKVTYLDEEDDDYAVVYNVKNWILKKIKKNSKEECIKCLDYYNIIRNMTLYDYYKTIEYIYFIQTPVYNYYKNDYKPKNSFELIKICSMLYPLITFLNENKILFDWTYHYILRYEQPVIILGNYEKNQFILIESIAFEDCENKIVDSMLNELNKNIYERYIAYFNNNKIKLSQIMTFKELIDNMLQNDYYASLILNELKFY